VHLCNTRCCCCPLAVSLMIQKQLLSHASSGFPGLCSTGRQQHRQAGSSTGRQAARAGSSTGRQQQMPIEVGQRLMAFSHILANVQASKHSWLNLGCACDLQLAMSMLIDPPQSTSCHFFPRIQCSSVIAVWHLTATPLW
jgi:hypothetical protein